MSCAKEKTPYKTAMNWRFWAITLIAIWLVSCETAHEIGRAITAPVRYVFKEPEPARGTATSDVSNPGQPVAVPSPTPTPRAASRKSNRPSTPAKSRVAANKSAAKPSPSPQKSASAAQFPVARPVPGRPGLVFNPFNASGGYIDVSGYAPGSKVKDPDSQQIFIVP
ncbi:MAG: hypothetical protein DME30_10160 [Verrucomicrobia bacterium]|nr:MAG: hypothetical protein DME30_10160 [Verrucomicrobiota bacterium]